MQLRRWHGGRKTRQEGEHVHLQSIGAVAKRPLEFQAHAVVGQEGEPLLGERRAEHVAEQALARGLVTGAGDACRVKIEPELLHDQRAHGRGARAIGARELHSRAATQLGTRGW